MSLSNKVERNFFKERLKLLFNKTASLQQRELEEKALKQL